MPHHAIPLERRPSIGMGATDRERIEIREVEPGQFRQAQAKTSAPAILLRHMLRPYLAVAETAQALRAGDTVIHDLGRDVSLALSRPYHAIETVIPWSVLDRIAQQANAAPISSLDIGETPLVDDTIQHLMGALLPPLRGLAYSSRSYIDHLGMALATHVAHAYGGLRPGERLARGGLAPHVLRRAQAALGANLQAGLPIEALAQDCGLSLRHFTRAFQASVGLTPHRWIMSARVAAARAMIDAGEASLAEVALACGFADQSHMTRVFKRAEGVPPAAWRRDRKRRLTTIGAAGPNRGDGEQAFRRAAPHTPPASPKDHHDRPSFQRR